MSNKHTRYKNGVNLSTSVSKNPNSSNPLLTMVGAFSAAVLTTVLTAKSLESATATIGVVILALILPFGLAFFTGIGKSFWLRALFLFVIVAPLAIGGALRMANGLQSGQSDATSRNAPLTEFQLKHGIGPVTEKLNISGIDSSLVAEGEILFRRQCASCHKLDERLVGPALRDVANRRSPEYMMNMILNPAEMVQKHPEARKLLAQHLTVMTYQGVSQQQARALVEFLRFSAGQR